MANTHSKRIRFSSFAFCVPSSSSTGPYRSDRASSEIEHALTCDSFILRSLLHGICMCRPRHTETHTNIRNASKGRQSSTAYITLLGRSRTTMTLRPRVLEIEPHKQLEIKTLFIPAFVDWRGGTALRNATRMYVRTYVARED